MKVARSRRHFLLALGAVGATPFAGGVLAAIESQGLPLALAEDAPYDEVDDEFGGPDAEAEEIVAPEDADRSIIQAYYSKPQTGGGSSYLRYTPVPVLKAGAKLELALKSKLIFATPPAVRLVIYGPPPAGAPLRERGPVVASAVVAPRLKSESRGAGGQITARRWIYPWNLPASLPDGNFVLHANWPGTLPASVIVANGVAPPVDRPRRLAVCSTNMKGDRPLTGPTWFWIDYPVKRRSLPIARRAGLRFTAPMTIDNIWVEDMTAATEPYVREPLETDTGWVVTNPQQRRLYLSSSERTSSGLYCSGSPLISMLS